MDNDREEQCNDAAIFILLVGVVALVLLVFFLIALNVLPNITPEDFGYYY